MKDPSAATLAGVGEGGGMFRRLSGLRSELGGALGSQGGGGCYGPVNLAREGLVAVN